MIRFFGNLTNSSIFAAFMVGLYASVFYLMTNVTMLPIRSALVIAVALIAPVTIGIIIVNVLLEKLNEGKLAKEVSLFLSGLYLMVLMRVPLLETKFISNYLTQIGNSASAIVKIMYCVLPALVLTVVFRHDIRKFSLVLGIMTMAAVLMNIPSAMKNLAGNEAYSELATNLSAITLSEKPNIYFILADGYGSFAYMNEKGINVSSYKNYLRGNGFRLYDEVFSNYHPTTAAMPAMLHMEHHYYTLSEKTSEVTKAGRVIVGGENNLVQLLKRNGYQAHNTHQGLYLLTHGCSIDCYPETYFSGAKTFLNRILPTIAYIDPIGELSSIDEVQDEVVHLIERYKASSTPHFQYIHLYVPGHTPNKVEGICNEGEEEREYSKRVSDINVSLPLFIDNIISRDPSAVIVIAGDHGPFITHNCSHHAVLSTLTEYRDRVGVVMAIRWPESYDGRYDDRIKTTINIFRYVLASLTDKDTDLLKTLEPDDVYINGNRKKILKVVQDGNILIPPEHYARDVLQRMMTMQGNLKRETKYFSTSRTPH